jgi:SAM-dependent methyltransferase
VSGDSTGPGSLVGPAFTDVAGEPASTAQLERIVNRYVWASEYCGGARVVEIACGSGQGLGLLAGNATQLFAADYSAENLETVQRTYGDKVPLIQLDAQRLPFRDQSFDVVVLLEALYFLPSAESFVREAARVLRPKGRLLLSVINKDNWDFQENPLYPRTFGAPELAGLLTSHGFHVQCFGALPMDRPTLRRVWLKRIVFGKLVRLPFELTANSAPYRTPRRLPVGPDLAHQVVLCEATLES